MPKHPGGLSIQELYLIIITSLLRLNNEGSYIRNGHLYHPLRCGRRGGGVVLLRVRGRAGVRGHLVVGMI